MARKSGRRGRVYLQVYSTDTAASPIPYIAQWTINESTAKTDVTAMGDLNKVYVSELPDASGSFSGFFDDASNQTYNAATDGAARLFYLYADATLGTAGTYWFGTVLADFSVSSAVGGAITMSATWNAASTIARVN